ncbi:hypothetical protein BH10CYA1_BH10CYA1_43590 [soil metagenome]
MKEAIIQIYLEVGTTASSSGHLQIADTMFGAAIEELQTVGEKNGSLCKVLFAVSEIYVKAGRISKALNLLKRALIISENVSGRNSSQYLEALDRMAALFVQQGKLGTAELYLKRAQLLESSLPIVNVNRQLRRLLQLCAVVSERQKPQEAECLFSEFKNLEQQLTRQ